MGQAKRKTDRLAGLDRVQLERMAAAGVEVERCNRALAKANSNIVAELIRGDDPFYEWNHYPEGDAVDWETHSQYYYHAHPQPDRPGEHGHFHTFMRFDGMAGDIAPAPLDHAQASSEDRIGCHLIAVSMDKMGTPIRLFTVNRWVTDETWYGAGDVVRMLDGFEIDHTHPSWATNRWLGAMFILFRPEIEALIGVRDDAVAAHGVANPGVDVFEDRALEITSSADISVEKQRAAVARALSKI